MAIKVFADGANLEGMLDMHDNGNVQGFTTNPSLYEGRRRDRLPRFCQDGS